MALVFGGSALVLPACRTPGHRTIAIEWQIRTLGSCMRIEINYQAKNLEVIYGGRTGSCGTLRCIHRNPAGHATSTFVDMGGTKTCCLRSVMSGMRILVTH